jgi:hypothetical protein
MECDVDTEFCFNCLNYDLGERYCVLDGDNRHRHEHCGFWELAPEYLSSVTRVKKEEK